MGLVKESQFSPVLLLTTLPWDAAGQTKVLVLDAVIMGLFLSPLDF